MAIPNNPQWSSLNEKDKYVEVLGPKPDPIFGMYKYDISPGPAVIGVSSGRLNSKYWMVNAIGSSVYIRSEEGGSWGGALNLFTDNASIASLSLTFDQQGRPVVFFRVGLAELRIYWFNPETSSDEIKVISTGYGQKASFDVIEDSGAGYSDILLFYIRDNIAYMRVQRDKFQVEYVMPAAGPEIKLISSGMRVDNRYQVVYQYHDENYVPPPPQPPLPPEFTGDYVYIQGGKTQFGLEKPLINSAQHDDISLAFNLYRMDGVLAGLNPTWGAYGIPIFCEGEQTTIYPIPLSYNTGFHFDIANNTGAGYLREYKLLAASKFHLSFMYIEKVLYLVLVINGRKNTAVMPFVLSDGRWSVSIIGNVLTVKKGEAILFTTEVQRGTDASEKHPKPGRFGAYTLGPLYRMWRQNFGGALYAITTNIAGVETHYPLMTYNSQTQESIPPGNNISIYNYKPANWKYIAG